MWHGARPHSLSATTLFHTPTLPPCHSLPGLSGNAAAEQLLPLCPHSLPVATLPPCHSLPGLPGLPGNAAARHRLIRDALLEVEQAGGDGDGVAGGAVVLPGGWGGWGEGWLPGGWLHGGRRWRLRAGGAVVLIQVDE